MDDILTLTEIEKAVEGLPTDQKLALRQYLDQSFAASSAGPESGRRHSVLDIPAIRIGPLLRPFDEKEELLNEMLEGRQ